MEYNFVLKINFKNPHKKHLGLNNSVYFCRRPKSNFTNISEFYFSTENKLKRGGDRVKVSGEVCKSDSTIEPIYIGMDLEKFTPGNFPLENSSPRQVLTATGTGLNYNLTKPKQNFHRVEFFGERGAGEFCGGAFFGDEFS